MRLAFRVGQRNSGAALPTGGGSKAKIAVAISDVKTVKASFLFINSLESEVVKLVQFSCDQHIGKERREHKCGVRPKKLIEQQLCAPRFGVFPRPCLW